MAATGLDQPGEHSKLRLEEGWEGWQVRVAQAGAAVVRQGITKGWPEVAAEEWGQEAGKSGHTLGAMERGEQGEGPHLDPAVRNAASVYLRGGAAVAPLSPNPEHPQGPVFG